MNNITINGQSYTSKGSISVINGKVIIDGKEETTDKTRPFEKFAEQDNCKGCGAPLDPKKDKCNYCSSPYYNYYLL